MVRRLDTSGATVGSEFQVAPSPNVKQTSAQAGVDDAGRLLVTWRQWVDPTTPLDLMGALPDIVRDLAVNWRSTPTLSARARSDSAIL